MIEERKIRQIQELALKRREMGEQKYGDAYWTKDMYKEAIDEHLDSINYNTFQIEKLKSEKNIRLDTVIRGHEDIIKANMMIITRLEELSEEYQLKHKSIS